MQLKFKIKNLVDFNKKKIRVKLPNVGDRDISISNEVYKILEVNFEDRSNFLDLKFSDDTKKEFEQLCRKLSSVECLEWLIIDSGKQIISVQKNNLNINKFFVNNISLPLKFPKWTILRSEGKRILLENVLSTSRLWLETADYIGLLSNLLYREIKITEVSVKERALLSFLARLDFFEDICIPEYFEFHDYYFHISSRIGDFSGKVIGATKTPKDSKLKELSRFSKKLKGKRIILRKSKNLKINELLLDRQSIRGHNDKDPITYQEVSDLLLTLGQERKVAIRPCSYARYKTYPTGGSLDDLEIIVHIRKSIGLEPGSYFFDSKNHELVQISDFDKKQFKLAKTSWGAEHGEPQIVLSICHNYEKRSARYQGTIYRNALIASGALLQTALLIATEMGLSVCPLGIGNISISSKIDDLELLDWPYMLEIALGK